MSDDPFIYNKVFGTLSIIASLFLIITFTVFGIDDNSSHLGHGSDYDTKYWAGECIKCKSDKTEAYHTFWYNDDNLATGSYDYNKTNADYTIAKCHQCGYTWKIYL